MQYTNSNSIKQGNFKTNFVPDTDFLVLIPDL